MKLIVLLPLISSVVESANILAVLPYPLYSHYASFLVIFKELAVRGHNVTIVSPFSNLVVGDNITGILLPNIMKIIRDDRKPKKTDPSSFWFQMVETLELGMMMARSTLESEPMRKLIADNSSKFDLVICEAGMLQEPFIAFGHKFNAPVINAMSKFFYPRNAHLLGHHFSTSYVPLTFYFGFNDRMSFVERLQNSFMHYWDVLYYNLYFHKEQDALMRTHFKYPGSEYLPPIKELISNMSLTLMEHDFAVGYPVALHKNVVTFTGVGIKKPDPLPDDLEKFMDENKEGVIYFSMGSLFKFEYLQPYIKDAIISAFNKLDHKIFMKMDDAVLPSNLKTEHVTIKSWFPQRSILAHPNCKLFITHGGIHGTMEGFYHGVPMISIPLASDQKYNSKVIETHGLGISLDLHSLTETKLSEAINEVLRNNKYKENAVKRSEIFRDTPLSPLDNAIYWIEYVIRHKGAPHLRPAVLDLHWYQYLMLDVMAFYLLITSATIFIIIKLLYALLCILFCLLFCRNQKKFKKE